MKKMKCLWVNERTDEKNRLAFFKFSRKYANKVDYINIQISAQDKYKLYVNKKYISMGPPAASKEHLYYDSYKVKINDNKITVCPKVYAKGVDTNMVTMQNQIRGFIAMKIEVVFSDGKSKNEICDENTIKAAFAPEYYYDNIKLGEARISNWGGYKEIYDLNNLVDDWMEYDEGNEIFNKSYFIEDKQFTRRDIKQLKRTIVKPSRIEEIIKLKGEVLFAKEFLEGKDMEIYAHIPGSFPSVIFDFEKETVGYLKIKVKGDKDSVVSIWYGESLDTMRVDTFVLDGKTRWLKPFNRRAFRYVKLEFHNSMDPFVLYDFVVEKVHYDYELDSYFRTNDKLLNKIWETSKYTVLMGTQEHFEDSVWREEMQWLADARVMSLVNYYIFADYSISRKAIKQFFDIQYEDGRIPASGPQRMDGAFIDFSLHFVLMIYEYIYYSKDLSIVDEYFDKLVKLMDRFEKQENELGFLCQDNKWGAFVDWADVDKRGANTFVNCLYYSALIAFDKICKKASKNKDKDYLKKADILKKNINEYMYDKENKLYADSYFEGKLSKKYSQQCNLMAVHTDVYVGDKKKYITHILKQNNLTKIKGAFLLSIILDVFFLNGHEEYGYNKIKSFYGEMLNRGATTWWETFDPDTKPCAIPYMFTKNIPTYLSEYIPVSHCHGWGAGPAYILMKYILGVRPLKEGFEQIEVKPFEKFVKWAEGRIKTVNGNVDISWHKKNDDIKINIIRENEQEGK